MTSRYGVIIVDMQDFFLKNVEEMTRKVLIQKHKDLLQFCAQSALPTFVLELTPSVFGRTTEEIQRDVETVPLSEYINKRTENGFENTPLSSRTRDLSDVVVTGLNANACVYQTAKDACARGITVHIAEDLIASSYPGWRRRGKQGLLYALARSEAYHWYRTECQWYTKTRDLIQRINANFSSNP